MRLHNCNGYWFLRQNQKDIDGKYYDQTIARFGKTKPTFHIPFVYRGCSDDFIKCLKDKSVNLILTDPPFGITDNKWDVAPDWKTISTEYDRILSDNGQLVIFGTVPNILAVYYGLKDTFDVRYDVVWNKGAKTAFGISNKRPLRTHENILVFKKKGTDSKDLTFNPKITRENTPGIHQGIRGRPYTAAKGGSSSNYSLKDEQQIITVNKTGYKKPITVISASGIGGGSKEYVGFPTQKPESVMAYFIKGLTNVNDVVFDPYLGSGTTVKVAMEHARLGIGCEIDPVTFPIIEKRIKSVMKQYPIEWIEQGDFLQTPTRSMTEGWK